MNRPVLVVFAGARSIPIMDTVAPLRTLAEVVVVTSRDIIAQRGGDGPDDSVEHIVAKTSADISGVALSLASRREVVGAVTFSEDMVALTARFAYEVGVPGQPPDTLAGLCDKYHQRARLALAGIPVPCHASITEERDIAVAATAVPLPGILKPRVSSGGAFASVVADADGLAAAARKALASGTGGFILESVLTGGSWHRHAGFAPYVSVESVAGRGRISHLAVTDRFPLAPPLLETGMMLPSSLSSPQQDEIVAMADSALRALGFVHGVAHTELMLTDDGPRVIEVNARTGGALPYLFPLASDLDIIREAGRVSLGQGPPGRPSFARHSVFLAPRHPIGVQVRGVDGLDHVGALPGIVAVVPLAAGNVSTADFQNTLIAAVLGVADTPADAAQLWREVMAGIHSQYEPTMSDVRAPSQAAESVHI